MTSQTPLRFSCADFAFPLLGHDDALRLIKMLGVHAVDIGIFSERSHLRPESIRENPARAARELRSKLNELDLELSDVFVQFGADPSMRSANDPDAAIRRVNREAFAAMVEFAHEAGAIHMTGLPGVKHTGQSPEDGLRLAADETMWRVELAGKAKITYSIEPHVGSICPTPDATLELLALAPGLTLTFDPGHFVYQGMSNEQASGLIPHASHFHARCGAAGRLQAKLSTNQIDFAPMVHHVTSLRPAPWICLEYVWVNWEGCNEVDNISETILLKRHLESIESGA
jgi:sugar phosphate isomerase/epimerase